jgi:mRNA interferase HicA
LVRELERFGCELKRSGGRDDIYFNPSTKRSAPIPRVSEIQISLCKLIRRQLGLEEGQPSE